MGSKSTTVNKADPWAPAQPYILEGLDAAQQMFNSDPNQFVIQPWGGPAIAGMSGQTQHALNGYNNMRNQQDANMRNAQGGLQSVQRAAISGGLPGKFEQGVNGAVNFQNDPTFSKMNQQATQMYSPKMVNQEVNQARNLPQNEQFGGAVNSALNEGTSNALNKGVALAQQTSPDAQFNYVTKQVAGQGPNDQFKWAAKQNLQQGNDAAFDRTVGNMTGDGYDDELRNALRTNTMESIMPGLNQTFAGSGMTGSSLHQAHLTKALASGMANTEADFLNRAQDRQFDAGMASQQAHENRLGRQMDAGAALESAYQGRAQQSMDAVGMRQTAADTAKNRALTAGQAYEGANRDLASQRLSAGQMASDDEYRRTGLGLDAANMADQSNLAYLDRRTQAGNDAQAAAMGRAQLGLQGGQSMYDAYNTNQNRALSAIGMQPGMTQAAYTPMDQQFKAGQYLDNRAQTQLTADIMADQQRQAGPIDAINNYLSLTSGLGGQFGSSTAQQSNNPGLLGILGGVAPLFSLFSDRRLKENIRQVGITDGGLPVYTFRYKGEPQTHMGVMAQDVEQVNPDAVSVHESGYKMVDYAQVA